MAISLFPHMVIWSVASDRLSAGTKFGHEMIKEFQLSPGFTNFNHGSFGSTPREVVNAQRKLVDSAEERPDEWFRIDYREALAELRPRISEYINAEPADVVFVENASAGVNAVLRSMTWTVGDVAIILSTAYGMVKKTLAYLTMSYGIEVIQVHIPFPTAGASEIVALLNAKLDTLQGKRLRIAVFSEIASVPALLLPVEQLSATAKAKGVDVVMIDGAHALGQIQVDMKALSASGADVWVGNGHKWLYSPKGSALLWAAPGLHRLLVPTVISSEFKNGGDFLDEFLYTGTRDYTSFIAMDAALNFRARCDFNIL